MSEINYALLDSQVRSLLESEPDALASACNFVALLFQSLADVNWLGIYLLRGTELVLGPFQGKPACARIDIGKGVCGTAAAKGRTQRVSDVREFDGHIACDASSRAELVVPLAINGELIGVLDIDSPTPGRFGAADEAGVEKLCGTFCELQSDRASFI